MPYLRIIPLAPSGIRPQRSISATSDESVGVEPEKRKLDFGCEPIVTESMDRPSFGVGASCS
jgi:hypothetical protein